MYAGSAAARRRRVLIAARSESPPSEDAHDSSPPMSRARSGQSGNGNLRVPRLGRQSNVTDPAEEPRSPKPTRSDRLPARPAATDQHRLGDHPSEECSLSVRSPIAPVEGLPARRPVTEIARVREHLHPSETPRTIELCITSRLTGESEVLRIDTATASIGRGSQCDIRLMHPDVSRRHACIQVLEAGLLCYDLGSRTGVLWGGRRRPVGWITTGQAALIGPFEIRLATEEDEIGGGSSGSGLSRREIALLGPPVVAVPGLETMGFEVSADSSSAPALFVPLRSSVTLLGRGPQCEMRLEDDRISRVHSSVMAASDGVWLMDLAGRGGVRINGSRVNHARLEPGDEIEVGRHRLRFVIDQPWQDGEEPRAGTERIPEPRGEGYVSESLVLAMVETFAEMQRQMQEQFSAQMNSMVELVESLRQDSREEVRAELVRLKSLGEEIRETQSQLAKERLSGPESRQSTAPRDDPENSEPEKAAPRSAPTAPRPPESVRREPKRRHYAVDAQRGTRDLDGIADHAIVSRRLRELEEERDSSWKKLVRLISPGH